MRVAVYSDRNIRIIRQPTSTEGSSSPVHSNCQPTLRREKMSSFSPSPAELALVTQIFAKADPQKIGILTGDAALKVFGGAKLAPTVLGEIWNIADEDNNGWLPRKGVAIAVRLMGWAQKGEKVTQVLVNKRECVIYRTTCICQNFVLFSWTFA